MLDYTAMGNELTGRMTKVLAAAKFLRMKHQEQQKEQLPSVHYGALQRITEGYSYGTIRVGSLASRG